MFAQLRTNYTPRTLFRFDEYSEFVREANVHPIKNGLNMDCKRLVQSNAVGIVKSVKISP